MAQKYKLKILIFIGLLLSSIVFCEEIAVSSSFVTRFDSSSSGMKVNLSNRYSDIKYDTETEDVYYYVDFRKYIFMMVFDKQNRNLFSSLLNKYLEWNQLAKKEKVKITKDIGEVVIDTVLLGSGSNPYKSKVKCIFFSQTEEYHNMVMRIIELNRYGEEQYGSTDFYMNQEEVRNLLGYLSDDSITEAITKHNKIKSIDSVFK